MTDDASTPSSRRQSAPGTVERQDQLGDEIRRQKIKRKFQADRSAYRKKKQEESAEYKKLVEDYPAWDLFSGKKKGRLNGKFKAASDKMVPEIADFLSARQELDKKFDEEFLQKSIAKLSGEEIHQLDELHQNCDGCIKKFLDSAKTLPLSMHILEEFFRQKSLVSVGAIADTQQNSDAIEDLNAEDPGNDSDFFDPNDHQERSSTDPVRTRGSVSPSQNSNGADVLSLQAQNQKEEMDADNQMAIQDSNGADVRSLGAQNQKEEMDADIQMAIEESLSTARNQNSRYIRTSNEKSADTQQNSETLEDSGAEDPGNDSDFFDPNDHQEGPSTGPVRTRKLVSRSQNSNVADVLSLGAQNQKEEMDADIQMAIEASLSTARNRNSGYMSPSNTQGALKTKTDDEEKIIRARESHLKRGAYLRATLPYAADRLIDKAWNTSLSLNEKFVEGFNIDIERKDLLKLKRPNWLNDNIINYYLQLVCDRSVQNPAYPKTYAFNTFFYKDIITKGYSSVKRWTRKVDIFLFEMILVPVHLGSHWCLAVIDMVERKIEFYDSLYDGNMAVLPALKKYIDEESVEKKKVHFDFADWEFYQVEDVPRQTNNSDCGVFVCQYAECASRRQAPCFTQENMPYFRKRMVYEIVKKKLLPTS
ncbi:unnamed protein product [Caenorhabditis brenneri]